MSRQLVHTQQLVSNMNSQLRHHGEDSRGAVAALNTLAGSYASLQATLNQALTRMAAYEDRMMVQTRRVAAVKGTEQNLHGDLETDRVLQ